MDPFAAIMLGGVAGLVVALLLLGRFYPGSGADQLDWRPTRSPAVEVQNEVDDLDQLREAVNVRRRARGDAELTEEAIHARVAEDLRARITHGEDADEEAQLRAALAAKRAARREPRA